MCSNHGGGRDTDHAADTAARLSRAIDELAAAVESADQLSGAELASRLAGAWAVVAAADPELGVHLARYGSGPVPPDCGSHGHELRVRDGNADDCAGQQ